MCRMRISIWSRSAANSNSLVDQVRWSQIQKEFPTEIKNRMEGKTAILLEQEIKAAKESMKSTQPISKPGEINKEYQEYLAREEEKRRLERENEERMSVEYIQTIIVIF